MSFVYPGFLWAGLLLLIPIIIHLFHFRRYKKIIFPHVKFLQDIQKETQSVKKVRNLLVLLARLFALLFLILAFAQPFKPMSNNQAPASDDIITLYIDNSFSMEAKGKEGPLFEEAKNKARQVINSYGNTTRYLVMDNSGRGASRPINRDDAIRKIDEAEISHVPHDLSEVMKMAQFSLEKNGAGSKLIYLISDFQKTNEEKVELNFLDSSFVINALPVRPISGRNISIDSAWLDEPQLQLNTAFELNVKITNRGVAEINESTVALDVDGVRKSAAGFDLGPGESVVITMGVTLTKSGWQKGVIFIEDEDLAFDNAYFVTFNIKDAIRILTVNGSEPNPFISGLFQNDDYFKLINSTQGNLSINELKSSDLLIINEVEKLGSGIISSITDFAKDGGTVLVVPKKDAKSPYLTDVTSALGLPEFGPKIEEVLPVSRVDINNPLFSKVFEKVYKNPNYPTSQKHFRLSNHPTAQSLIRLRNEDIFLSGSAIGNGKTYILAVPLDDDWSTFQRHALFVPVLIKMALNKTSDFPLSHTISRTNLFRSVLETVELQTDVLLRNNEVEWVPNISQLGLVSFIDAGDADVPAGNIEVRLRDSLIQIASFNFNRSESISNKLQNDELAEVFADSDFAISETSSEQLGRTITEQRLGKRFWKLCIILCLIFLAIEILLLRFWPNSQV